MGIVVHGQVPCPRSGSGTCPPDPFVTLLRYIHQNPTKGQIVDEVDEYPWSSWKEYEGVAEEPFCSTPIVLKRIPFCDLLQLVCLLLTEEQEKDFIDVETGPTHTTYTDKDVWQLLESLSGATNATQFQALPRPEQKHYLYEAHEAGVGPRTLSRLTGVPYSIVQRATSGKTVNQEPPAIVSEPDPWDELYETYLDEGDFEQYPEY